ncbi:MAG TPA: nucleotidyltransferase domain-containing protein [Candidatus Acidoferrales bacterium]|nr:nucleotidyltransferase domain-containing protein [Candidatus Acidoferrales bacterium]
MAIDGIRIRDFIITHDNWIFAVIGYDNSSNIQAYLRYVPDEDGDRIRSDGKRFKKVGFDDAYRLLKNWKPHYLNYSHLVPFEDVAQVKYPQQFVATTDDEKVLKIAELLENYGVDRKNMGVTGSRLVDLQAETSDVDFVVYGRHSFERARGALKDATQNGELPQISAEMWSRVYEKRRPELTFEEFVMHEKRKWNRGVVDGTYFDLLFVRDYTEIKIEPHGVDDGCVEAMASVTNVDFAFDNPAIYEVDHDEIAKVLSYTHTYVGQALVGETVEVRGVYNKAGEKRVIVGTTREATGEWIKSCTLLSGSAIS